MQGGYPIEKKNELAHFASDCHTADRLYGISRGKRCEYRRDVGTFRISAACGRK